MEIYICDDSRPDLMRLAHHLKEYILNLDMHVEIRSFSSGESILAAYKRALVKPSLIFLDIYMGSGESFARRRLFRRHYLYHKFDRARNGQLQCRRAVLSAETV